MDMDPAHRMLSNVTSRAAAGQSRGGQSGGLGLPRSTPMSSSPGSDTGGLTNLKIRTAAGSVTLSGLDRGEADELAERISRLTDLADDV